jgi:hypothetical protein
MVALRRNFLKYIINIPTNLAELDSARESRGDKTGESRECTGLKAADTDFRLGEL